MKARAEKHKKDRGNSWKTFEGYRSLDKVISQNSSMESILLDCITTMVTNIMFEDGEKDWDRMRKEEIEKIEDKIVKEIEKVLEEILMKMH